MKIVSLEPLSPVRLWKACLYARLPLTDLDRRDTAILKAIAIFAIVFHNFFHVLGPVHENEFNFDAGRFPVFLHTVVHPAFAIQALFSFFGHYGVQIFIFLSAYGLAKTHWDDESSWSSFMGSRIKKLYPMFILVVVFWALLAAIQEGAISVIRGVGPGLLLVLAGISNLVPGRDLPVVGPWWFIPFIMQFYAIWPLLRKLTRKFGWPGLVVLCVACFVVTFLANPFLITHWSLNLAFTPIGRIRVFCLGIIAARHPVQIRSWLGLPAIGIIILGNEYHAVAHFSSLAIVVFSLWLYAHTRFLLRSFSWIEKVGNYSLAIFLVNGVVRIPFLAYARTTPLLQLSLGCASAAVTFAVSAFFHYLLEPAPETVPVHVLPQAAWGQAQSVSVVAD
ncbi:MAG TPA: acyltransferase [Terracidiphilus sp.]|jgi:peptidoglycan/LPS O-acetylase OafA/YrhL